MVEDVDGNRFLDFNAGIAVCSTGHCHPDVVRAIQKQAETLIHMSGTDFYYEQMPQLARKLESLMPGGKVWSCFFGNSGTEADRSGDETCALRHRSLAVHCISFVLSWPYDGRAVADVIEAGPAERIRAADSRRHCTFRTGIAIISRTLFSRRP